MMRNWLLGLAFWCLIPLPWLFAQKLVFNADNPPKLTVGASFTTALSFVPSSLIVITNHEIGHTLVARLAGDRSAYFKWVGSLPSGGTCIGCSFYDPKALSRAGNALVPVGGFLFSQGLAFGTDALLKNLPMKKGLQRFVALTYLLAKFDMSFQSLQGLIQVNDFQAMKDTGIPSGTDMNAFAFYASNANRRGYHWILAGMMVLSAIDIYLCRKTISRNWRILINKGYYTRR
ncbi:MAG: hypothetical protein AAGA85_12365 [Bacteroidota bacterium]